MSDELDFELPVLNTTPKTSTKLLQAGVSVAVGVAAYAMIKYTEKTMMRAVNVAIQNDVPDFIKDQLED